MCEWVYAPICAFLCVFVHVHNKCVNVVHVPMCASLCVFVHVHNKFVWDYICICACVCVMLRWLSNHLFKVCIRQTLRSGLSDQSPVYVNVCRQSADCLQVCLSALSFHLHIIANARRKPFLSPFSIITLHQINKC